MATLDEATLEHVARIARLALTPEERRRLAAEASSILEQFAAVERAAGMQGAEGPPGLPPRADEVQAPDSAQVEAIVAQFPSREGRLCKVPGAL